ncbi:MAG: HlyD family efflux transporter periplasmic adaptor subunit [Planctomycetota bacterium]|nr:HlyD family efflux transporter periplasmic adaptor subunit [Planctomycetota bacterium]
MTQKVLVALSLLVMAVSFGGYFWQSKKIEVRTPLESAASSSKTAPSPEAQYGPELANAPIGNQETLPKLVQIDRGQSDRVVPTPIALTQTNLIPALPAVGQAAAVPALEATQDGRLRYKAILSFVNDIKVVAQTDGIILDILVDEGSAVAKDTIMIQIDNRLAVAEREVASKELESAKLKAEDDSQIKFSVASYEVATSVFNRSQELFAKVVEAQEEWEKKRLEKIKAGFQIDVSKREQLIAQAAVGVNEAKVNASNVQLELRTIKAPFTGVVASMQKERFDWVKAGEEILRLVSLDKFRVKGTVRIADSPNTLEGARANVIIPTGAGKVERLEGVVGFVSPESQGSGARNDGTQEYTVWVEIPNKQVGGKYLFRGAMDAIVEIIPNP